jgi:hypothetical protein
MIGSCALATDAGINTNNTTSTTPIFLIPHCASFCLWVDFTQLSGTAVWGIHESELGVMFDHETKRNHGRD